MKNKIQSGLQRILGYKNYLLIFSIYKYFTMRYDSRLHDFFYFLSIIPHNKAVLDIGANLGYMSLIFSRRIGKNKVVAFEPVQDNFNVLVKVLKLFKTKNIIAINCALGEKEDEIEMITPVINGVKKQGLSKVAEQHTEKKENAVVYKISQKKLDAISELKGLDIGAIKIDVEGYEKYVFKGGIETIEKNKPIIFCELWEEDNFTQCKNLLMQIGYKIFYYQAGKLIPYDQDKPSTVINFFFIHPQR